MKKHFFFLVLLFSPALLFSQVKIQVLSAVVKDKKIEGAEVLIQKKRRTNSGRQNKPGWICHTSPGIYR